MYIYIYIHIYICMYIYIYRYINTHMHTHSAKCAGGNTSDATTAAPSKRSASLSLCWFYLPCTPMSHGEESKAWVACIWVRRKYVMSHSLHLSQRALIFSVLYIYVSWFQMCVMSHVHMRQTQMCHVTHTATHCDTLQHTATHCNTLQHTATHCNTLQRKCVMSHTLQHTATHCYTLQHTATQMCHVTHTAPFWASKDFRCLVHKCAYTLCARNWVMRPVWMSRVTHAAPGGTSTDFSWLVHLRFVT